MGLSVNPAKASFSLSGADVEPVHWAWALAGPKERRAYYLDLGRACYRRKILELAAGIGVDGRPLRPVKPSSRPDRATGPPLSPHEAASRFQRYLVKQPFADPTRCTLYWTQGWAKVVRGHMVGWGHLPVRDVVGLTKRHVREAVAEARAAWALRHGVEPPPKAPKRATKRPGPTTAAELVQRYPHLAQFGPVAEGRPGPGPRPGKRGGPGRPPPPRPKPVSPPVTPTVNSWTPRPAADFRAIDPERADQWAAKKYARWASSLDDEERGALKGYATTDYAWLNRLRRGEPWEQVRANPLAFAPEGMSEERARARLHAVEAALARARVPEPIVVWRGVKDRKGLLGAIRLEDLEPGTAIVEDAIVSTSLDKEIGTQFAAPRKLFGDNLLMKIHVPKAARAGYLNAAGVAKFEFAKELTFAPGTRYRVVDRETAKDELGATIDVLVVEVEP